MDCQFIMGTLAYMYYQGFIAQHKATVGGVLEMAITGLTAEEQIEVVKGLSKYLVNQGLVSDGVSYTSCNPYRVPKANTILGAQVPRW
jgi:phosphatidate cytidylyltransferase